MAPLAGGAPAPKRVPASPSSVPDHRHPHTHPELAPPPPPKPGPIVTLTTDIGWAYAAQMKAVLLRGSSNIRIVDVTHEVPSHGILEGAFMMRYTGVHFPPGTIHVGIVDPGVGSDRQPLIIRCADGSMLVGPDNGLLMPLATALGDPQAWKIRREKVVLGRPVSATFEGRDLFAPTAVLLASGEEPASLAEPTTALDFHIPSPHEAAAGTEATILHVDVFGNLITNLPFGDLTSRIAPEGGHVVVQEGHHRFRAKVVRHYSELEEGVMGLVGSSYGLSEFTMNRSRADRVLLAKPGARVFLRPSERDWKEE